jgi:glucose/arabinose dehydrogenase
VADAIASGGTCARKDEGDVREYNERGGWIDVLDHNKFKPGFYPRGVVFGPDGMLYVAARGCPTADPQADPNAALLAYLLRFNPCTHRLDAIIATNETVQAQGLKLGFHRPEGLVFDEQGFLWVTSFRDTTNSDDVDRILKFDVRSGEVNDSLPLSEPKAARASAQAIIFAPDGKLYIPISGNAPDTTGQLRRCDTRTKKCETIVKVGGGLIAPWFPIFRSSDPATLSYKGR